MTKEIKTLFNERLAHLKESLETKLDAILVQTTKTNGRVKTLEEETAVVRFFHRHPKVCIFLFVLVFVLPWNMIRDAIKGFIFNAV